MDTNEDLLQFLQQNGTIDLGVVEKEMEMRRKKEYLAQHKNKIWKGENGKYFTHLPDEKRTLVCRISMESMERALLNYYDPRKMTMERAFLYWVQRKIEYREITQGTYERYVCDYRRYLEKTPLNKKPVCQITENDLENLIRNKIIYDNLTAKQFANMRTILNGIFKYAKKKDCTKISISTFFHDLDISKKSFAHAGVRTKPQVFNDDEIGQIMNYCLEHKSVENLGIILAFYTGLRVGELAALKFSDIEGQEMHIQRQEICYHENGKVKFEVVEYTKTEAGDRFVIIPKEVLPVISDIQLLNPDGEYMMMNNGKKYDKTVFNRRLYRACKDLAIPKRSMHKIRKTYGTILIDQGVSESLVMTQMGHSDISTTRKYYYYTQKTRTLNHEQIERAVTYPVNLTSSPSPQDTAKPCK